MKNFIRLILVLSVLCNISCEDPDTQRIPLDGVSIGPNVRIVIDTLNDNTFNFDNIDEQFISYNLFSNGRGIDSMYLEMVYITETDTVDTVVVKVHRPIDLVNGIISDAEITSGDIVGALGVNMSDINSSDTFVFLTKVLMTDGRLYPSTTLGDNINIAPLIENSPESNSFTFRFDIIFECPADFEGGLAGTYNAVASGFSTDPGIDNQEITDFESTVRLTSIEGTNRYTISSISGGLYVEWYLGVYDDVTGDTEGTVEVFCDKIAYVDTDTPFGDPVADGGVINKETGVITISGEDTGFGDTWTMVMTPIE